MSKFKHRITDKVTVTEPSPKVIKNESDNNIFGRMSSGRDPGLDKRHKDHPTRRSLYTNSNSKETNFGSFRGTHDSLFWE